MLATAPAEMAKTTATVKNSWRGITPLRSSAADVARALGVEGGSVQEVINGPLKTEGGEVTFSYLTASLAKIYRAPRSMIGKVFTIYFKPDAPMQRAELKLPPGFKRCSEQMSKAYYYLVSDAGVAYQFRRDGDNLEMIIYQPSRAEVSRLAVTTECIF